MIDLHSHVLPGIDDGAGDLDESIAMCKAAARDGIHVLAATPHVRHDYPTTPAQMEAAFNKVRVAVGDVLRLVPGGELDIAELDRPAEELARFGLAGNPRCLLIETPYFGWPLDLADRLFQLRAAGFSAVLAHPERNPDVEARPELLEPLVAGGTLVQLTAASVDGRLGRRTQRCARRLLDLRLAHLIASDAHAPHVREIGMSRAVRAVGDGALAAWLSTEVPRAIMEGRAPPPRPDRRRLFSRSRAG